MNLQDILMGGGGAVVVLTLVQIAPIKINPWSAIGKALGRAFNVEVLEEIKQIKANQEATSNALKEHIRVDDERNADSHRARILEFNTEILRELKHTREDFIEILAEIDFYEDFCKSHPGYQNNRCTLAIENIRRVYSDRMQKHDFL